MLIYFIGFLVSLLACLIGRICGLGGGVIIKPALDSFHIMDVASISFLSGCTILAMTSYSVYHAVRNKEVDMDMRISTPLAVGSCIGGVIGKSLFQYVKSFFADSDTVGMVQALLMLGMLIIALLYTLNKKKLPGFHLKHPAACAAVGCILGLFSAFIGGGSGPINMVTLVCLFSMSTKLAAVNSLYIILFSQVASLAQTVISGSILTISFNPVLFVGMVIFAIVGSQIGRKISVRISEEAVNRLFVILMLVLICVNIRNAVAYF